MRHRDWSDLSPAEAAAQERYVYEHRFDDVPSDYCTPDELEALEEAASADEMADAGAYDQDSLTLSRSAQEWRDRSEP